MQLSAAYDFLPKQRTSRATIVMDHFGVGFEEGQNVIAEDLELPIKDSSVVLFTGQSGSGKSTLMRSAIQQIVTVESDREALIKLDELDLPDCCLIDALSLPAPEGMALLSACGLGEAQLMLRTPMELSDGQRYRFRLALALSRNPKWIVADEFTATLDRVLAQVIAFNVRRLSTRHRVGFLIATTHEDIVDDLSPDMHVRCSLGADPLVIASNHAEAELVKKSLVCHIPLDLTCGQVRLGVLRSVALPQPRHRDHPYDDDALARRESDRNLRLCRSADLTHVAESILWTPGGLEPHFAEDSQSTVNSPPAGGPPSDLPGSWYRRSVCQEMLRTHQVSLDRDDVSDGTNQPTL